MWRVGWRSVRAHIGRFLLSLLAVALGVAFVAGTFSLRSMMSGSFAGIVESSAPADAYLMAPQSDDDSLSSMGSTTGTVPLTLADEAAEVEGVATALPTLSVSVVLIGADGTAVQSTQAPSMAVLWHADDPNWGDPAEGRGPRDATEIALEKATLESSGLEIGDTTSIVLAGQLTEVTVVGMIDPEAAMMGASIVLLNADAALAQLAPDGQVGSVEIYAEPGVDQDTLVERLAPLTGPGVEAVSGDDVRADLQAGIDDILGFVATFLLVFAGIALFVGAFIISNTFAMSVRQRMREFALLRAVGASPLQVFGSILGQAAIVGLVGSALGVLGGFGLVEVLRSVLGSMGMEMAGDLPVDTATIVVSMLVGTVVSVLAAAVPARRAALVPPVEAMRDEVVTTERSLRPRALGGLALVLLGAGAIVVAVSQAEASWALTVDGIGAAAVLIGVLMLSPVLARTVVGALAWPLARLFRPVGRLARGNVVRNPRRTANTAGALMIGMALVGAVSVIAVSAKSSLSDVVEQQTDGDFVLSEISGAIPGGLIDDVEALPDVEVVDAMRFALLPVQDGGAGIVAGIPEGMFGRSINVEVVDGSLDTLAEGQAVVKEETADADGWEVGDQVTLNGTEFTVGAIISTEVIGAPWMVGQSELDQLVPRVQQLCDVVMIHAAPGADLDRLQDELTAAAKPYVVVAVMSADEWTNSLAAQVDQILVIMYALLGLSVVIAVLGIVNTLALSVIERTREIGLLRAVGLGRLQLSGTVVVESVLTAVFGTVVGLVIGVGLAATLPRLMEDVGFSTLSIPWLNLAGMVVLAVVVGVIAALWPAIRAARMKVLDSISYE
ncbi:ABC transporter permease [Cellulomonas denverensis]|uniref:FtsX-like permease family protein n=1 Tax=Cellulomonas denverensis TaxID=264297 RepID=A0A7X6KXD9_9CELL|nr:FtsX-like permease family protein [Cellulomonas denverensis]NKY23927.1 FtsX-like permease family protein [Cellulomonas denverensis]GIG24953.1 ABC transporter permease [Cellulomonas denverensis]